MSAPRPQFVAVPVEVLAVARDHLERMALMDLACMADEARWEPFMASERYLVERWKMLRIGSTKVRRLLAGLVEAGWLRVIEPEARHLPRKLQMRRPTRSAEQVAQEREEAQKGNAPHNARATHPPTHPSAHDDVDGAGEVADGNAPPNAQSTHPPTRNNQSSNQNSRGNYNSPKPPQPPAKGAPLRDEPQLSLVQAKPPARVLAETLAELGVELSAKTCADLVRRGWTTPEVLASLPPTRALAGQGHLSLAVGMGARSMKRLRAALAAAGHQLAENPPKDTAAQDPRWRLITDLFKEVFLANGLGERVIWEPHRQMTTLAVQIADVAGVSKRDPDEGLRRCRMAFEVYLSDLQAPENWPHEPTLTGFAKPQRITARFTGRATPRAPAGRRGTVNLSSLYHGLDDEPASDPMPTTWS